MKVLGVEMQEAGYMPEKTDAPTEAKGPEEKRYPSFYVDDKEMPEIAREDLGDKIILIAVVEVQRKSEEKVKENGKQRKTVNANLKIVQYGFKPYSEKKAEELDDKELHGEINRRVEEASKE